ncbi:MAG: DUF479 domain-containing protein [Ahniella sp.]|nr:DUF479 domain-containing protein [Ahniella sp.]
MNHLAHFWLADADPLHRLGVALGDFWRGSVPSEWPQPLREGLAWHRRVDSLTDSHTAVVEARNRFVPPYRRYAGILLDMWCDHALARGFGERTGLDLEQFSSTYLADLRMAMGQVENWMPWPDHFLKFVAWLERDAVLPAYAAPDTIERTLAGIGRRLQRDNPLHEAWPILADRASELDDLAWIVLQDLDRGHRPGRMT